MRVNKDKIIVDALCYLSDKYPNFTIIDNPQLQKVRVVNDRDEVEASFSYEYIIRRSNLFKL